MILRNLYAFYILLVLPLVGLILGAKYSLFGPTTFTIGLGVYIFFYHPLISGLRLLQIGKIQKSEFWYNFIPFWNKKYFTALFFGTR